MSTCIVRFCKLLWSTPPEELHPCCIEQVFKEMHVWLCMYYHLLMFLSYVFAENIYIYIIKTYLVTHVVNLGRKLSMSWALRSVRKSWEMDWKDHLFRGNWQSPLISHLICKMQDSLVSLFSTVSVCWFSSCISFLISDILYRLND